MKKQAINFSWPATLSDFTQDNANEKFSRCKLKTFFKGETEDHRYFSNDFSEQIIETLPYTPVVSFYNEEEQDFVGHAREQQIFGIVDPCVEPTFETDENGKEWCIADIVLYTERPDKIGEIAKQIVGHPHSLELDPSSVKYVINYDERKHFKNIEFTEGSFVGVSVLGKNQKPAFSGSEFFNINDQFEQKMQILRDYCVNANANADNQSKNGGEDMNLQEFMKLSWGEVSTKVYQAIAKEYEKDAYISIVDMFDDQAIVRFYYYVEESCKLMRVNYTCDENGNVVLGEVKEVRITYVDVEEAPVVETADMEQTEVEPTNASVDAVSDEFITETSADELLSSDDDFAGSNEKEEEEEKKKTKPAINEDEDADCACGDGKKKKKDSCCEDAEVDENSSMTETIVSSDNSEPAHVTNVEDTPIQAKASMENEQISTQEGGATSIAALNTSERAEFEALKKERKENLVQSYKNLINDEVLNNFMNNIDSFDYGDLEVELLKEYKRAQETNNDETTDDQSNKPMRGVFAFTPVNNNQNVNESPLDAFVRKYKR